MLKQPPQQPVGQHPAEQSIEQRQRDVEFGNSYRLEYIKHLIFIAAGMFAFTVTFMHDLIQKSPASARWSFILVGGWAALVVSIVAGIQHMRYWAWFFISWGRSAANPDEIAWRARIDFRRKIAEGVQLYGFFVGLACLLVFAAVNLY